MSKRRRPPQDARAGGTDAALVASIDRTLAEAARKGGSWLACRVGCTECCIGPFPITGLDAERLRGGLERLASTDPERAEAVRRRAREAAALMRHGFPGDAETGLLVEDDLVQEGFLSRFEAVPCPALDPPTGACELYESRPVSCRTFGPPVRIGGQSLPPCRLCFQGAPEQEVERCRVEFDPGGREAALLAELERSEGTAETVIAFALAGPLADRRSGPWPR